MPGNVFLEKLIHDLVPQVSHAAGIASLHECNRFALIVRRLAHTFLRKEKYQDENRAGPKVKKFHFYLRPSFRFFRLKYLTKRLQEIFPAKTPSTQRKKFTYFPKLGALCAFAGVFFRFRRSKTKQISNMFG